MEHYAQIIIPPNETLVLAAKRGYKAISGKSGRTLPINKCRKAAERHAKP
jgi:hypothetical protein